MEKLIEVYWDPNNGTWSVSSRPHGKADWVTLIGAEGELDTLLSIARDVVTGGD